MMPKVEAGLYFLSNRIEVGDSVSDCSMRCIDNVLLERCLVRREHQTQEEVVRLHSVHRG